MTPILNPASAAEHHYNRAHIQSRAVIERTFGVLKSRMRSLDRTGGAMVYSPQKVCKIVVASCIIHNIAIRHGMPLEAPEDVEPPDNNNDPPYVANEMAEGRHLRQNIIRRYFT